MVEPRSTWRVWTLPLVVLLIACSGTDKPRPPEADTTVVNGMDVATSSAGQPTEPVPGTPATTVTTSSAVTVPPLEVEDTVLRVDRPPPSYLEEVIPPCVPTAGAQRDPCAPGSLPVVAILSVHASIPSWPFDGTLPTLLEALTGSLGLGESYPELVPHIVVRATGQPDTTRCELYPITLDDLTEDYIGFGILYHYHCFVNFRINEYIVGTGPAELTVSMHREVLFLPDPDDWADMENEWLASVAMDPQTRTAAAYEGNELVMFLGSAKTLALEAWSARWGVGDLWSVQRADDETVTAVAADFDLAIVEEDRNRLNMPLADLTTKVKAAAATRTSDFSGRVGASTNLPMLVTDANELNDFYVAVGAVYEGDDATTVLPPPPPPGVPTNVELSTDDDGTILVTWDTPESGGPVEDYYVTFRSDLGNNRVTLFNNVKTWRGEEFFEITYMADTFGNEFTVQVRAGNAGGYSDWTQTETFANPQSTTTTSTSSSTTATTSP